MRAVITGGTGLIGSALADSWIQKGHEVIVLTRRPVGTQPTPGMRFAQWDGRSTAGWAAWVDGADVMVNLAGESIAGSSLFNLRWTPDRKRSLRQSRLDAGQAVVEAIQMARRRPSVLIQASAVGYYGAAPAGVVNEASAPGSDFLAQLCVDWEASTASVEALGIRRVVARLGVVLTPRGGALPKQELLFRCFAGGPIGSGRQPYPWIHLDDAVGVLQFLAENPAARGAYNLTAPQQVDNAAFGRTLANTLRRPYWLPAPAWVFRLLFGQAATVLLDGQAAAPQRLAALGYPFCYPQLAPALQASY